MTIDESLNLAAEHHKAGRLIEAREIYRQVLASRPDHVRALNNLGVAFAAEGQWGQAIECFERAVAAQPDAAEGHVNLGGALATIGRRREAVAQLSCAAALQPNLHQAHYNLGLNFQELGELDQAIESLHRAVALAPSFADGWNNLANAYKATGRIDRAKEFYDRAFEADPNFAGADSNRVYILLFDTEHTGESFLRAQRGWQQRHAKGLQTLSRAFKSDRSPDRRLRVGYVSPDFRAHCQSIFTEPLFSNHDHERFEVVCYSGAPRPDAVTERLRGYADIWRSTAAMTDEALAETIRTDGIDILVDLTMHMAHGRPLVMARKPAPVQVAWLAYPGTTGLDAMDYRLTDPYLDPLNLHDDWYSERSIRLPETFWCYDAWGMELDRSPAAQPLPEPGPLPANANGYITFGCLNDFCKINDGVLELWSRVLRSVADSRLRLSAPAGETRRRTLQRLAELGVAGRRVEFVGRQPRRAYLAEFQRIDLCLDTLPYNGHTTSLDSFWMGVPVISRIGRTVVGRAGWSQLSNLGLAELAAHDDEQFVSIAARWAGDLPRLAELRRTLRPRMHDSPLTDGRRFARNIETAYHAMWKAWREKPM